MYRVTGILARHSDLCESDERLIKGCHAFPEEDDICFLYDIAKAL